MEGVLEEVALQKEHIETNEKKRRQLKEQYHKRDFLERLDSASNETYVFDVIHLANLIRFYLLKEREEY